MKNEVLDQAIFNANKLSYAFSALTDFFNFQCSNPKHITVDDLNKLGALMETLLTSANNHAKEMNDLSARKGDVDNG